MSICLEKSKRFQTGLSAILVVFTLAGCANFDTLKLPAPLPEPERAKQLDDFSPEKEAENQRQLKIEDISDGTEAIAKQQKPAASIADLKMTHGTLSLNADAMPLNRFIHIALGEVLGLNFDVDSDVAKRTDPVTLHVSSPVQASRLLGLIEQTLAMYEVGLAVEGDVVRVGGYLKLNRRVPPSLSRGKLLLKLGRVMEIIPLEHTSPAEALAFARHFLSRIGSVDDVIMQPRLNALLVIGHADRIRQFRGAIRMIDRPTMKGMKVSLVRPVYWKVEALEKTVSATLRAQGLPVNLTAGKAGGMSLISVKEINALIMVSPKRRWLKMAENLIGKLDAAEAIGEGRKHFIYFVRYTNADKLGSVMTQVLGGQASTIEASPALQSAAGNKSLAAQVTMSAQSAQSTGGGGRVIVDKDRNALIFVGAASEYRAAYELLTVLDRAPRQVLLEATIADISLDHTNQLGVEWGFSNVDNSSNYSGTLSTLGGLGLGAGGITYSLLNNAGLVRAKINALATKGNAKILSSPTLLAMDGEEARIQIGTQVAVVTSEISDAGAIGGGTTGLLRTFQYIDTGVIMKIEPTITEQGIVQLKIHQEVSEAGSSNNNTPPIATRLVDTVLSVASGQTIMIGGLITHNQTENRTQVPFLGDIPLLGHLFSSTTLTDRSTEMIIMITPHVIYGQEDADFITNAFREKIGWKVGGGE